VKLVENLSALDVDSAKLRLY